jgi:mRNA-degrading endonuclease RelE of RelBE toxin-antitoxin system
LTSVLTVSILKIMATVKLTSEADEQMERLPKTIRRLILKLTDRLKQWPNVSGAKPLSGNLAGWYRMRTRDYRLRFRVQGDIVTVDKIGHRRDFYED